MSDILYGRNPVLEALHANKSINKILIAEHLKGQIIDDILKKAREKKIVYSFANKNILDKITANHQGVIAYVSPKKYILLDELLANLDIKNNPVLCILDQVTDPHNLGAVIRSAYALNIDAILLPKRDTCPVNETVAKVSSGALEFMNISHIDNVNDCIKKLKEYGFWVVAADMDGVDCYDYDFKRPTAIVLGAEGHGVRRLVKENSDDVVKIPMNQKFDSLNVSCAASILFYEISRQKK